jgi:hypothetical protein
MKRIIVTAATIIVCGWFSGGAIAYGAPDNDDVTSDDAPRWCGMEGVTDPLWSCPVLRRGEEERKIAECSVEYKPSCDRLEHETDWLRGTGR